MAQTQHWEVRSIVEMMNRALPVSPSIRIGTLLEAKPEVTPQGQTFYPEAANMLFGHCTCPTLDGGGDCPWCICYYNGPEYAIATSPVEVA